MEKEDEDKDYIYEVPDSSNDNSKYSPLLGDGKQNALVKMSGNPFSRQFFNRLRESFMNNVKKVLTTISKPFTSKKENENTISPTIISSKTGVDLLKDDNEPSKEEIKGKNPDIIIHAPSMPKKETSVVMPNTFVGKNHSKPEVVEEVDSSSSDSSSDGNDSGVIEELEPKEPNGEEVEEIYDPFGMQNMGYIKDDAAKEAVEDHKKEDEEIEKD